MFTSFPFHGEGDEFLPSFDSMPFENVLSESADTLLLPEDDMFPQSGASKLLIPDLTSSSPVMAAHVLPTDIVVKPATVLTTAMQVLPAADMARKKQELLHKAAGARKRRMAKKERLEGLAKENEKLRAELSRQRELRNADQMALKELRETQSRSPWSHGSQSPSSSSSGNSSEGLQELAHFNKNGKRRLGDYVGRIVQSAKSPSPPSSRMTSDTSRSASPIGRDSLPAMVGDMNDFLERKATTSAFYLDSLENSLECSTVHTNFVTWLCTQEPESFYTDVTCVWRKLFEQVCECTSEQLASLTTFRANIKFQETSLMAELAQSRSFKAMRQIISKRIQFNCDNFKQLSSILAPEQIACFFQWVTEHGNAAMQA